MTVCHGCCFLFTFFSFQNCYLENKKLCFVDRLWCATTTSGLSASKFNTDTALQLEKLDANGLWCCRKLYLLAEYNLEKSVSGSNGGVGWIYISKWYHIYLLCRCKLKAGTHSPKVTIVGKCGEVHACIKKAQKQLCFHWQNRQKNICSFRQCILLLMSRLVDLDSSARQGLNVN